MPLTTLDLRTGPIRLDRATTDDVAPIVALLADDAIAAGRGDSTAGADHQRYAAGFAAVDADPGQLLVVARADDGAVVGTMQLSFIPGLSRRGALRLQIEAVRVADSQRGSGLGTAMINWALDEGRRRGATLAQLTSDAARADAHRFYSRLGFADSHIGFKLALDPSDTSSA